MKKSTRGSRVLAWICVVLMLVMMLPLSGFGETEQEYDIKASVENGSMTFKVGGTEVTAAQAGDTVTVEVTPNAGYEITALKAGEEDILTTMSFTMPAEEVTVAATIVAKDFSVTANTADHGTFSISKTTANVGDTIEITDITPDANFALGRITYNDGEDHDITDAKSFTMPAANVTVTVAFYRAYTVDVFVQDTAGNYSSTPTTYTYYAEVGTELSIAETDEGAEYATPAGYELDSAQSNVKTATLTAENGAALALYYKAQAHDLSWTLTNLTVDPSNSAVTYNIPIETTITAADYYEVPAKENVSVKIGGSDFSDFTYTKNSDGGSATFAIDGSKLLGDVEISAVAVPRNYALTWTLTDITVEPQDNEVTYTTDLAVKLVADTNYILPAKEAVSVTVDGSAVDFTYTPNDTKTEADLTVSGDVLNGVVVVTASGVLADDAYMLSPASPDGENGWYRGLTISPKPIDGKVSLDNVNWQDSIYVTDGNHTGTEALTVYVQDNHNNTSAGKVEEVKVDTTDPVVTVDNPTGTEANEKYYTNQSESVTFTVIETNFTPTVLSGDATTDLTTANFAITTTATAYDFVWVSKSTGEYTCTITLACADNNGGNADGEYTVELKVNDLSGRTGSATSASLVLDKTSPSVTGVVYTPEENTYNFFQRLLGKIFNIYQSDKVNVTVTATDTLSPVDHFVITDSTGVVNYTLAAALKGGVYTATTTDGISSQYKGTLTIKAYDKAGNESSALASTVEGSTVTNNTNLLLDTQKPNISLEAPDYTAVHTSSYSFGVSIQEPNAELSSGLNSVTYSVYKYKNTEYVGCEDLTDTDKVVLLKTETLYEFNNQFDPSFESNTSDATTMVVIPDNLNSNLVFVEVTATDNAGNSETARTDVFKMDNTAPVVSVRYNNDSAENSKYFKDTRTATVTVTDNNFSSNNVNITTGGSIGSWSDGSDSDGDGLADTYTCTIDYMTDNNYTISITASDLGGNATADSDVSYTGTATQDFTVDLTDPEFEINYTNAGSLNTATDKYYTNTSLGVSFTVVETNFAANQAGCSYVAEFIPAGQTSGTNITDRVSWNGNVASITLNCADWADGEYTIRFSATDFAGRTNECETKALVLDDTAPENLKIEYTETKVAEKYLNAIQFGIFKEDTVNVTVTATDANSPITELVLSAAAADAVMGQKTVNYSTSRNSAGVYTVTATYVIAAQYKDQLTVTVTDFPSNKDTMEPAEHGSNSNNTNVVLDTVQPVIVFNNPDYSSVHNSSYSFTFTVTDDNTSNTSSGLNSVSYAVYKYDSSSMSSSTSLSEVASYTFASGDFNVGNTYTATIPLESGNATQNSNLVYVVVTAEDNAGNETVLSTYQDSGSFFKMDNTAPIVRVSYDNDSAENSKYFKDTRTATVTVVDNNFSSNNVNITTGGSATSWTYGTDSNGDGLADTYTCTIGYMTDNDYTISITASDLGGNATADSQVDYSGTATQEFTIDLTSPTYAISFTDGETEIEGGKYSQSTVMATLSIVEHNFDEASATAGINVTRDGADISESIRSLISWSSNGDTRTATFELPDDGEYTVDMSFVDLAGNNTAENGMNTVFVDQNDPVVKVTGVANESANADDEIILQVTISDKYYDAEHGLESIALYNGLGENVTSKYLDASGASEVLRDEAADTQMQTFTFKNITEDDIYSLAVVHTDLSGRQNSVMTVLNAKGEEEEFSLENDARERFSVNRNGSTYTANESTLDILGDYVQSATNVHIIETNVDELDPESIHIGLTHDSNNRDLVNGTDFTYQTPPMENESGWHIYEYALNDSLFEEDGVYTVTVYSEDAAGNISQNNTEEKNFEVMFIVDKTAPIYVPLNLKAGEIYNQEEMTVTINVSDNIALDEVHVYTLDSTADKASDGSYDWSNAEELDVTPVGGNGDYTFVLHEGNSAATSKQSALIVCTDKAGNQNTEQEILDFTVSSSFWIRYYANKPLFYGSIGGIVVVLGGAAIVFFRKKEETVEVQQ